MRLPDDPWEIQFVESSSRDPNNFCFTAQIKWVIQLRTDERQKFEGEWVNGTMKLPGASLVVNALLQGSSP